MKTIFLNFYKFFLIFIFIFNFHNYSLFGQANNNPCVNAPSLTVGSSCSYTTGTIDGGTTFSSNNNNFGVPNCGFSSEPDVWYAFDAPASGNVLIETASGTLTDGVMEVYSSGCEGSGINSYTSLDCDDDSGPGFMPELNLSGLTPGDTYFIRFWEISGSTGTFDICVTEVDLGCTQGGANISCATSDPFCTGNTYTYCNTINQADAFGAIPCDNVESDGSSNPDEVSTSPNPAFFYMKIDVGGNISIDITQEDINSAGLDVDFVAWGPFTSISDACNSITADETSNIVDCSYSIFSAEEVNLFGTISGEYYMLLITNYSNDFGTFDFAKAAGAATTDCGIVLATGLYGFNVKPIKQNGKSMAKISWSTYWEENNSHFEIESSFDGFNFEKIGTQQGKNNSDNIINYEFIDRNPLVNQTIYYRLKSYDFNGTFETTNSISTLIKNDEIHTFPNPSTGVVNISKGKYDDIQIEVKDLFGDILYTTNVSSNEEMIKIDLQELEKGTYIISIYTNEKNLLNNELIILN